jgi:hypothetical protein
MSMKGAKWSGAGENVNDHTSVINTVGISWHSHKFVAHELLAHGRLQHAGLPHAGLPHARLLDGSDVQAEMLHTRMQSLNFQQTQRGFQQAQNGLVSIERHFAGRDFANSSDGFERSDTQSFSAQSVWSYLHALPVEAKLK